MRIRRQKAAPYKGLAPYEEADAYLFGGREVEVEECARLIHNSSTAVFVLHGLSGSGKTSFIRAGLLPKLRNFEGFVPMLVMPPCDAATFGGALDQLGKTIRELAAGLVRKGGSSSLKKLKDKFESRRHDPQFLYDFLVAITLSTPKLPVLFVDQAEEIVRTTKDEDSRAVFIQLLRMLCSRRIDLRICLSMRSEYKALLDDKLQGAKPFAIAGYCLQEMSPEKLKKAISVPTSVTNQAWERFSFQKNAIEELVEKAIHKDVIGGPLIAAQIMCDRLYKYATDPNRPEKIKGIIRTADVFALGHPNEQIAKHIQESLYEAFEWVNGRKSSERQMQAARADQWLHSISRLVIPEVDGRATSSQQDARDLIPRKEKPHKGRAILRHLSDPREYVLKRTSREKYTLQHDTIALALRRWKEAKDAIDPERSLVASTIVRAASYTVRHLWPNGNTETLNLDTVDDSIWDHLILLYAQNRKFSERLGIKLDVPQKLASPGQRGDYSTFLESSTPKVAILPIEIVPVPPNWRHLAVTNVFTGYAVTGSGDFEKAKNPLIMAFDPYCKRFGELFARELEIPGARTRLFMKETDLESDPEGDPLYTWLMRKRGDDRFAIGPAPTRARWLQTNQFKEWDIWDLRASTSGERSAINDALQRLFMHEVCVVSESVERKWRYRIVALIFYTVQYILSDPSDFVSYIFDYELDLGRGRIPVAQDAIRETIEKSYRFHPFEGYSQRYLNPVSEYSLRFENCRNEIAEIYNDLINFRQKCDEVFQKFPTSANLPMRVKNLLRAAESQYQIYNYYDAAGLCEQAFAEYGEHDGHQLC